MMKRTSFYDSVPISSKVTKKRLLPDITLRKLTDALEREMIALSHERTARAYRSAMRSFLHFYGEGDIPLSRLNTRLLVEYEQYLLAHSRTLNTISFYMRNLRAIYNKGVKKGWLAPGKEELFQMVYTGIQPTRKKAIEAKEIRQLERWVKKEELRKKAFPEPLMSSVYYFLFCFYARGMSYVDMAYLKKSDIRNGVIRYRRKKTGQYLEIRIIRELQEIIDFFASRVVDSPYLFPIIRRKDKSERLQYESGLRLQNKHLKEISREAGLDYSLSTHVARHTWATIAKKEHIPLSVISEGLGHTSPKTTAIYLASFDNNTLDQANVKVIKAIKRAG